MNASTSIVVGEFDDFVWIRCEGKGNFLNSPLVKRVADAFYESGRRLIVVDLDACTGMDSTFMGTLAGLALKLNRTEDGKLQIARASERSEDSLSGLGLDMLMEINPEEAVWKSQLSKVEEMLGSYENERLEDGEQAQFCLDAHQVLGEANPENIGKFRAVVEMFESDIARRKS